MTAIRERDVRVLTGDLGTTLPELRTSIGAPASGPSASSRSCSATSRSGLLVLYHHQPYAWTADETDLARAFADQMATAIDNARLAESTRTLAARLRAIQDLAGRLNRIQDVAGIAEAIVAEARGLIDHDTIRVYRVDHDTGMCEPIAFQGTFLGVERPGRRNAARARSARA